MLFHKVCPGATSDTKPLVAGAFIKNTLSYKKSRKLSLRDLSQRLKFHSDSNGLSDTGINQRYHMNPSLCEASHAIF